MSIRGPQMWKRFNDLLVEMKSETNAAAHHCDQIDRSIKNELENVQSRLAALVEFWSEQSWSKSHKSSGQVQEVLILIQKRQALDGQATEKESQLNASIESLTRNLHKTTLDQDHASAVWEDVEKEALDAFAVHPQYKDKVKALNEAAAALEKAEEIRDRSRVVAGEKMPAFSASPFLAYLKERKFGTKEYRGIWPATMLDQWLASMVHFEQNQLAELRIQQLVAFWDQQVDSRADTLASLEEALEPIRSRFVLEWPTALEKRKAFDEAQKRVDDLEARLLHDQQQLDATRRTLTAIERGEDHFATNLVKTLSAMMGSRKETVQLLKLADLTTSDRDDRLIDEITAGLDAVAALEQKKVAAVEAYRGLKSRLERAEHELRSAKGRGLFNSDRIYRDSSFSLNTAIFTLNLINTLQSASYREPPRVQSSSYGSTSSSSSWSSSSGGFRTGGGFGGGGGGGGFRTGGGV